MPPVSVPGGFFWGTPVPHANAAPTLLVGTMNAAADRRAFIFTVPRDGVLNRVEFRLGTVTNNPDNGLRISFQNIDAAGDPDGTEDQFRVIAGPFASDTWITPGLITSDGTDTGTKRTVAAGDRLAVVIQFESFVAGDSVNIDRLDMNASAASLEGLEYYTSASSDSGATWTPAVDSAVMALEYETGGYEPVADHWLPILALVTTTYNNGSTPDERALRFQIPFNATCDGCWIRGDFDGDADIVLYDGADNVLATATMDASARPATGGANAWFKWDAVSLTANTTYRLALRPSTGTSLTLYSFTVESNGRFAAAVPGSVQWHQSTRTDAGSWTDTDTARPWAGLHFSEVDSGASGDVFAVSINSPVIILQQGVVGY